MGLDSRGATLPEPAGGDARGTSSPGDGKNNVKVRQVQALILSLMKEKSVYR
jgi:hypothetical protein